MSGILFLAIYAVGILMSLTVKGAWGFYLYQIVYFLYPQSRWWGASVPSIPYSFITVAVMAFAVVVRYQYYKESRVLEAPPSRWILALLCLYAVTQLYAVVPEQHEAALIDLAKMFVVLALAYKLIDTPARLQMALWTYVVGAWYIGFEAYNVGRNSFGRVEGIGPVDSPDANGVAAALAPAVPILMYFAWRGSLSGKIAAAFLGVWIVNGLVLINSRGAFLGVLAGSGYLISVMLLSPYQRANQRLFAVLIVVIACAGAIYLADDSFVERMSTLREVEDESKSGSHRYRMWLTTFDLVDDYPAGVGAMGYQTLSPIYVDPDLFFNNQTTKAVHSSWFQALAELGWLGLLLFIGLIVSCFRAIRRTQRSLRDPDDPSSYFLAVAIESGLIAYLVAGTFIDQFRAQILYWMILFVCCAWKIYCKGVEEESDEDRPGLESEKREEVGDDAR